MTATHWIKIALLITGVAGFAAVIVFLNSDNARLRKRVADAQRQEARVTRLREENNRTQEQVQQLREELARLEQQAEIAATKARKKSADDHAMFDGNRDLRRGLVRLEHLTETGRTTPESALQTLVWAALKGDDAKVTRMVGLSATTRASAETLLGTLPESARASWAPEKLASLFFTGFFTEVSAAAIDSVTMTDATHATLTVRVANGSKENTLPLIAENTPEGWRVMLPEKALGALQRRLQAVDKNPPK